MAIDVVYENGGEGILYVHSETLCGDTFVEGVRSHYQSLDYTVLRYQIVDLRPLQRVEMTTEQLKTIAELDRDLVLRKHPDHKLAIIVDTDSMYAIMKMWENYVDNPAVNAKIFHDMEAARDWIAPQTQSVPAPLASS